jgi:hypothetical protein
LALKKQLTDTFEMNDFGLLHSFLSIQVLQKDDGIFISQPKYVLNFLHKFRMEDFKPYATPHQLGVKLNECNSQKFGATLH